MRSTWPARIRSTIVGSPSGPGPSPCLRTIVARTPFLRRTSPVPRVAHISKPRSARRLTGNTMERLSLLATDTNARPFTGSDPYAAACDFAYAVPNASSMPMTSPVERISGPRTVSTPSPRALRNRPNGSTASLTAIGASSGSVPPSPVAGSIPSARSPATVAPSMILAAALASGTAVALETNGTVRDARGLASSTYRTPAAGDSGLLREVESLLGQHNSKDSVFDQRAWTGLSRGGKSASQTKPMLGPGAVLGPYRITGLLGAGGMGQVYRGHDSRLHRSVAIKVMDLGQDARRFEREARAVAALSHPNVVPVFDVGHDSGVDYLVEELVEGETLRELLRRGPLDVARFRHLAVQIAEGLGAAHRAGIIHRDLKPGNIMISREIMMF